MSAVGSIKDKFQSTLSVRRATRTRKMVRRSPYPFQSTLSVRRATELLAVGALEHLISIHALRKESDREELGWGPEKIISIHALRKESDQSKNGMASP